MRKTTQRNHLTFNISQMKRTLIIFAVISMMAVFTTKVMAQVTLSGNTAGAELVKVLTITNTTPLHFGVIGITAGTAGTVVMSTAGVRTPDAGTTTIINTGTQKTVALFSLTGTASAGYSIGLPSSITVTTATGAGVKTMTINALQVKVDAASEATAVGATGTLSAGGLSSFLLAGTLNIVATQQIGVYTGTYDVTVDYN